MANEGEFPKDNGDILYGSEVNDFHNSQWFVENFFENTVNSNRWTLGGTVPVLDTTSSTLKLTSSNANSSIKSNNTFGETSTESLSPTSLTTEFEIWFNLAGQGTSSFAGFTSSGSHKAIIIEAPSNAGKMFLRTDDGSTQQNSAEFDVPVQAFNKIRIELGSSNVKCYLNNTLVVTNSTNIPALGTDLSLEVSQATTGGNFNTIVRLSYIKLLEKFIEN